MAAEEPINQGAPGEAPDPPSTPSSTSDGPGFVDEHPEALVGAAFVGGFALAQILKQVAP